jgi:KEOPS complex subunit Cgi121
MIVDEYGKCAHILGYKLHRSIDPKAFIEAARDVCRPVMVQFFDAETLAGEKHLFFATLNAMKSFSQGRNIAQTLDVEILLYTSTQRQIGEAIRMVGLRPQTSAIATILVGDNEEAVATATRRLESVIPGDRDESVLDRIVGERLATLMRIYEIDATELEALSGIGCEEALPWLIVERAALLDDKR